MFIQENSSVYVNVKIEQSASFPMEMLSFDQIQANIIVASNDEKIKILTNTINGSSTTDDTKTKCLQSRAVLNFELKRWQEVINDINILQQSINSPSQRIMKMKANIQELCRQTRAEILELVNTGHGTDEIETFYFNINQRSVDQFLDDQMPPKSRAASKSNRQMKK